MSALTLPSTTSASVAMDTVYTEPPHGHRVLLKRSHVDKK